MPSLIEASFESSKGLLGSFELFLLLSFGLLSDLSIIDVEDLKIDLLLLGVLFGFRAVTGALKLVEDLY